MWAPAATIERIRADLEAERSTESFARKKEADARRRENAQAEYVEDFLGAVVEFLAFHPTHADLTLQLARVVSYSARSRGSSHRLEEQLKGVKIVCKGRSPLLG